MKRVHFLITFFLILLLINGYEVFVLRRLSKYIPVSSPFQVMKTSATDTEDEKFWRSRIQQVGPEKAYAELKAKYAHDDYPMQHEAAHVFGRILYQEEGVDGVRVCDSTFTYGCFHTFFAEAVKQNGISVLPVLDKACIAKYGVAELGCQHGLGHSILSYLGLDRVNDALHICDTLTWKGAIGGCSSGVFMEHNFHTVTDRLHQTIRQPNMDKLLEPCTVIDSKYRQACYYEQPLWWLSVSHNDYPKVIQLCSTLTGEEGKSCFRGIGTAVGILTSFDIKKMAGTCGLIADAANNELCNEGGAWIASGMKIRDATRLCTDLAPTWSAYCLAHYSELMYVPPNIQ